MRLLKNLIFKKAICYTNDFFISFFAGIIAEIESKKVRL